MREFKRQVERSIASRVACLQGFSIPLEALTDLLQVAILTNTHT